MQRAHKSGSIAMLSASFALCTLTDFVLKMRAYSSFILSIVSLDGKSKSIKTSLLRYEKGAAIVFYPVSLTDIVTLTSKDNVSRQSSSRLRPTL